MTKLRTPDSIEDACKQAAALLGNEAISTALVCIGLRASPSLIDKWGDMDAAQTPSLAQALAMESLIIKTGHAPIFGELFDRLRPVMAHGEAMLRPLPAAAQIVCSAADVLEKIEKAEGDGRIDPGELISLLAALERLQKRIAPLRRSLFARVKAAGIVITSSFVGARHVHDPRARTKRKRR